MRERDAKPSGLGIVGKKSFVLPPLQERNTAPPTAEEALMLSQKGTEHFGLAVATLDTNFYPHWSDYAVGVARIMVSVSASPAPIIDFLERRKSAEPSDFDRKDYEDGIAKVQALQGNFGLVLEAVQRLPDRPTPPTDAGCFAADIMIERGENPSQVLALTERAVETFVSQEPQNRRGRYETRVWQYLKIGTLYFKAGLTGDGQRILGRTEEMLDEARSIYNRAVRDAKIAGKNDNDAENAGLDATPFLGHDTGYDRLMRSFLSLNKFDDVKRMLRKLREDNSHYFVFGVREVVQHQLEYGLVDEAVETAALLGGPVYLKALARKALDNAQKGIAYQEIVSSLEPQLEGTEIDPEYVRLREELAELAIIGGNPFAANAHHGASKRPLTPDDYAEIHTVLGVAALISGNATAGNEHLAKAWATIEDETEAVFKAPMLVDLANVLKDFGLDPIPLYNEAFRVLHEYDPNDQIAGGPFWSKWDISTIMIEHLISRNDFAPAEKLLQVFSPAYQHCTTKAKLFAKLAAAEIRRSVQSNVDRAIK